MLVKSRGVAVQPAGTVAVPSRTDARGGTVVLAMSNPNKRIAIVVHSTVYFMAGARTRELFFRTQPISASNQRSSRVPEKMHRVTLEDAYTKGWFDYCRSVFPQSVRKAGPNVDLYNVSTFQCSMLFNNMGSFNRKCEFRKAENTISGFLQMKSLPSPTTLSCLFSENSRET